MADKEKKPVEKIQQLTEELLEKMGVEAKVTVEEDKKNKMFKISLSSPEDNALLVGRFGRNLEALQTILNLMTANALGEWQRVLVDIDGYRQKREEQLEKMAQEALEKVAATGEPVTFPGLSS
ncbi:MAG TPA: KH domain-containing protein, partial [Candidatus Woesebacteria bacterium]|nr:KH domain-containing protein [Candidatus Woesebacteria bacterium]